MCGSESRRSARPFSYIGPRVTAFIHDCNELCATNQVASGADDERGLFQKDFLTALISLADSAHIGDRDAQSAVRVGYCARLVLPAERALAGSGLESRRCQIGLELNSDGLAVASAGQFGHLRRPSSAWARHSMITNVRISMLSRGGEAGSWLGNWNAPCGAHRDPVGSIESQPAISSTSSRSIRDA